VSSPPRLDADLALTIVSDTASAQATSVASVTSETVDVVLNGNPRLVVAKSATPATDASPGTSVAWTITVINAGTAPAASVRVVDPIRAIRRSRATSLHPRAAAHSTPSAIESCSTWARWRPVRARGRAGRARSRHSRARAAMRSPLVRAIRDQRHRRRRGRCVVTAHYGRDRQQRRRRQRGQRCHADVVDVVAAPPPPPPPSPEPGAPIPVPTLDEWTMMLLAFLVVAAAWRKRRHVSTD
jgi:hypothetical protein